MFIEMILRCLRHLSASNTSYFGFSSISLPNIWFLQFHPKNSLVCSESLFPWFICELPQNPRAILPLNLELVWIDGSICRIIEHCLIWLDCSISLKQPVNCEFIFSTHEDIELVVYQPVCTCGAFGSLHLFSTDAFHLFYFLLF